MRVRTPSRFLRLTAAILLGLLACYTYSITYNLHLHITPEGRAIVHSHPHGDKSDQGQGQHTHSELDRLFIFHISKLFDATLLPSLLVLLGILCLARVRPAVIGGLTQLPLWFGLQERSPPGSPCFL